MQKCMMIPLQNTESLNVAFHIDVPHDYFNNKKKTEIKNFSL